MVEEIQEEVARVRTTPYLDALRQQRQENAMLKLTLQQLREACEREIEKRAAQMDDLKETMARQVKMVWGHHNAMAEKYQMARRELAVAQNEVGYLKEVEEWQQQRIQRLEEALTKCEKTRRAIFHDSRDDDSTSSSSTTNDMAEETSGPNKKQKTLHLVVEEARPQRKRRASSELTMDAYVENGVVDTTRELRQRPALRCEEGAQRCHDVGLNLLKRVLNHYTLVRHLRLEPSTYAALRLEANALQNLRCCTPQENREDTVVERELLQHMFRGEPLRSPEARLMLQQLQTLLQQVASHSSDTALAQVLQDVQAQRFPLQRYCFSCREPTQGREAAPSTLAFCSATCQRLWHHDAHARA